jgi:serine/threonine-protein kinase HipA
MHLKNLALRKIAEPGSDSFVSVRMAPLYDAVTTRVFPGLARDRMALKLNGKDDRLRRTDFRKFAATAGIKAADADQAIDSVASELAAALETLLLPPFIAGSPAAETAAAMRALAKERIDSVM